MEYAKEAKRAVINLLGFRASIAYANKASYNSKISLNAYSHYSGLKKPENTVLELLKRISSIKIMLDIGVGAGRTTEKFSSVSEKYIGIDYSENMIHFCKARFRKLSNVSFSIMDARNLSAYGNETFDFVLFSHGGLDAVEHVDREKILNEIRRVSKKDGYFCFSTSNLEGVSKFCDLELSKDPKVFARRIINLLLIRLINPEIWAYRRGKCPGLKHAMYNIGGDNWSLKTYCITPSEQIKQLRSFDFDEIRIFDLSGKEATKLSMTEEIELYFLCRAKAST